MRPWLWLAAAALLWGCAGKDGPTEPPAPVPAAAVRVEDNRVLWSTSDPAQASVRYGFSPQNLDHMAYPLAAGRVDRAFATRHVVPLLDLQPGRLVWYQVRTSDAAGNESVTALDTFRATVGAPAHVLTSTMIHIGFGDGHLLTMPTTGKRILVDAGERQAASSVETYFASHGVTQIDVALATHIHIDHLGGLVGFSGAAGVLEAVPTGLFLDSPRKAFTRSAYAEALSLTGDGKPVPRVVVRTGDSSTSTPALQWDPQVEVTVLNSGIPEGYTSTSHENTDINNESIVLKLSYGDVDLIIGGDAEQEAEAAMLARFPSAFLDVEFYKAQHHGLPDASSSAWVQALQPRVAFVPNTAQVWNGDFEAALAPAMGRLRGLGADVYVIDEALPLERPRGSGRQYNVTFATDGSSYEVRIELATQPTFAPSFEALSCIHGADFAAPRRPPAP